MADQHDRILTECLSQCDRVLRQRRDAEVAPLGDFGRGVAAHVGRDDTISGLGQCSELMTIRTRVIWKAVQGQDRWTGSGFQVVEGEPIRFHGTGRKLVGLPSHHPPEEHEARRQRPQWYASSHSGCPAQKPRFRPRSPRRLPFGLPGLNRGGSSKLGANPEGGRGARSRASFTFRVRP